ncbi:MAG: sigma-70 family RNA polymerase sigma factor [Verrucomicrobia bacterium]|nr:sigma-70 family RNA polymerase sigma factor [Verrucomicrobiota bacterium]
MTTTSASQAASAYRPYFVTTHWSVVLGARNEDSPDAAVALERLCGTYWYPLYAYVRRCGRSPEDARDLTQEFFAQLLAHNWIARADRHKGRFRSFLLMVMKRFLAKEWDRAKTLKRGGKVQFVALQLDTAESRYSWEPADTCTPDQIFEKQWALTLLCAVLQRLRQEYAQSGKSGVFEKLESSLIGSREVQPYAALATDLGMTENAVKMAVCRLRERYRECLKEEIAHTVAAPAEVEEELRHLFRVLARR